VLLVLGGRAQARSGPAVVYLDFSEGIEPIAQAAADDASANRSQLCETRRVGRWLGAQDCGDRQACREAILRETEALWRPFDIVFTLRRPAAGPYTMVVIGPASGSCGFGVAGAAPVDCGDGNPGNVAFAFECAGAVTTCARVLSHELGHTFGLAHSDRPCDLMSADASVCAEAAFHDDDGHALGVACGAPLQNSYRLLMSALGPRPDDPGGCALGRGPARGPGLLAVILLAALLGATDRRRLLSRSQ
jgi:hypothetical protein